MSRRTAAALRLRSLLERHRSTAEGLAPLLKTLVAVSLLNAAVSVRYPGNEPAFWYLLPALDVVLLLSAYALAGALSVRIPAFVQAVLLTALLVTRFIRIADGIESRYFARTFNVYFDLPLVPELFRLLSSTLPAWKLAAFIVLAVCALAGLGAALWWALNTSRDKLAEPKRAALVGLALAASLAWHPEGIEYRKDLRWHDTLAASVGPRLFTEIEIVWQARTHEEKRTLEIREIQQRLGTTPNDLAKLEGCNVYLFLVESYGQTVFDRPLFQERMRGVYARFESELGRRGFSIASSSLVSPTYGGSSWLAQATLSTSIATPDQFNYKLVLKTRPLTLPHFFREAGYRTVLAQPGTTRPFREGEFYAFDRKYYAWNFDYQGPSYGWASMPDQYVLDFIRRREVTGAKVPLFIEFVLVSSHAPWADQPKLVSDWGKLGNGSLYRNLGSLRFPVTWPELNGASLPYIHSIAYDFDVLERYLTQFVADDSLIVVLGDHQPAAQVTLNSTSNAVPIHVLSRRRTFIDAFLAKGYKQGMIPPKTGSALPMERFLPEFLRMFSRTARRGAG